MTALSKRSAGVRRLLQEAAELEADTCPDYAAAPLESDLFTWHFTIRGPGGEFEAALGADILDPTRWSLPREDDRKLFNDLCEDEAMELMRCPHLRQLPPEYPFKPPAVYMLTPSGRFEVNKPICLSISSFHPESWQPSWGVRTALIALMAFFSTEAKGAVGSLDVPAPERRRLAKSSREYSCPVCGFDASDPTSFPSSAPSAVSSIGSTPISTSPSSPPSLSLPALPNPHQIHDEQNPLIATTTLFPSPRIGGGGLGGHGGVGIGGGGMEPIPSPGLVGSDGGGGGRGGGGEASGVSSGAGQVPPPPQLPVLQHRPARMERVNIEEERERKRISRMVEQGGPPLVVDRLILVCLLALLALVVRKVA